MWGMIAIAIILVVIKSFSPIPTHTAPLESTILESALSTCLNSSLVYAISLTASQGGFATLPSEHASEYFGEVAFAYNKGKKTLPTAQEIALEIRDTTIKETKNCLESKNIELRYPHLTLSVEENSITATMESTVDAQGKREQWNTSLTYPLRLGYLLKAADDITERVVENQEWMDLPYLEKYDLRVTIIPYSEELFLYSITDEKSLINDQEFRFVFAHKFA